MRRIAVGIGAVFLLAACSSSAGDSASSPSVSTTMTASVAPARNLKPQLLTVAEMPTGWAVDNSSDSATGTPPCLKNLKSEINAKNKAKVSFIKGSEAPDFSQEVADFGSEKSAVAKYTAGARVINTCTDLSFTSDGHRYSGSIGQLSLPTLGQRSTAWRVTLTTEGITLTADVVLLQQGTEIAELTYEDLGSVDTSELLPLARKAVAKMPAA